MYPRVCFCCYYFKVTLSSDSRMALEAYCSQEMSGKEQSCSQLQGETPKQENLRHVFQQWLKSALKIDLTLINVIIKKGTQRAQYISKAFLAVVESDPDLHQIWVLSSSLLNKNN